MTPIQPVRRAFTLLTLSLGLVVAAPAYAQRPVAAATPSARPAARPAPVVSTASSTSMSAAAAVQVLGLRLVAPSANAARDEDREGAGTGKDKDKEIDAPAFYATPGTTLVLVCRPPEGGVIGLDTDASTVSVFCDNRGNSLLASASKRGRATSPIGGFPVIAGDGSAVRFEVEGSQLPAADATAIAVEGSLRLRLASGKTSHQHDGAILAAQQPISAGPIAGKVTKVGAPEWGDAKLQVELTFPMALEQLAGVRFLTPEGKAIKASQSSSMSMGRGAKTTTMLTFDLAAKVERATVVFDVWTDLREVDVPFAVSTGLGLGRGAR
jgi:hypothetical protein